MSVELFKNVFNVDNLRNLHFERIKPDSSIGIDGVNRRIFEATLDVSIEVIARKVLNCTYQVSYYKERLVPKGPRERPRQLSIPTIRDKLALVALKEYLFQQFPDCVNRKIVPDYIKGLLENIGGYDYYLRYDVKNFYGTLNRKILFKKLKGGAVNAKEALKFTRYAVSQKTVPNTSKESVQDTKAPKMGVPQGLPISNILADIYFHDVDKYFLKEDGLKYFRYVDDILILCKEAALASIDKQFRDFISKLKLKLNKKKCVEQKITQGIGYLGYEITPSKVTVRRKSIVKFRHSIVAIFTAYKYAKETETKKAEFILFILSWKLNLRITGAVFDKKKYGWLFFFSQINDLKLLYEIDSFIRGQCNKFQVDYLKVKRLVRSYYEITKKFNKSTYFINYDKYTIAEKRKFLKQYGRKKIEQLSDNDADYAFRSIVKKNIKKLLRDISEVS